MKKSLKLFAFLILSGCIYVGDIGAYWDKGTVDKALVGEWHQEAKDSPEIRAVTIENGEYRIDSLDEKSKSAKGYQPLLMRTLKLGGYTFFMTDPGSPGAKPGAKSSNLWRYRLQGERLTLYSLRAEPLGRWMGKKYPGARHIQIDGNKNTPEGLHINIQVMDDDVAKILASLPATEAYWTAGKTYVLQVKP